MENISKGSTLGDFVPYPHKGVDAGRHSCKNTELNVMYCVRVSLWSVDSQKYSLRNTKEKGVVGNLYISLTLAES